MLDTLRKGSANWLAKVLLGLLALSFAVWGIADVFRGWGQGSLARVGDTEITAAEYQRAFQSELDQIARQFGRRLTPDQAKMFGLDARVLSRLVGGSALDSYAADLGLGLSDDTVVELIQADPTFADASGKFDRDRFDQIMRQIGLRERAYIVERRKEEVRDQLTSTLASAVVPPPAAIETLFKYQEQTRTVQHVTVDAARLIVPTPTEAQLKETYEQRKAEFMVPEYRKVAALLLTKEEVVKRVPVSEDTIKAAYEQNKMRFDVPEQRRVLQIGFKNKADAEAAAKAIAGGRSFEDVAKAQGASASDIDLGLVTKVQMLDPKVADAAFALVKDKVSGVVDGRFSSFLLKVNEIVPGRTRPYDEVKGEIRDTLAGETANKELNKLHDDADDARLAGKTLKEIADQLKLTYVEVPQVDRSGQTADGKPAFAGLDAPRIVEAAFATDQGQGGDPLESADGGWIYVDNLGVTPSKQKPFEDVKADVQTAWIAAERRKAAAALADKLVERGEKGEAMAQIAKDAGGQLVTTRPFKRTERGTGLPTAAVQRAFILSQDAVASAETEDGSTRVVFKVVGIDIPKPPSQQQSDAIAAEVTRGMQNDVLAEFIAALQDRYKVSVNEAAFRRLTGGDAQ